MKLYGVSLILRNIPFPTQHPLGQEFKWPASVQGEAI